MRLTKLELHGFKSFADHTQLVFEPGATAIVGPNGCGKSNVSDAVRWVLGEQRARVMRGANMQEVIFQGSSARRPVNVAEVSLHFENDDGALPVPFREVVITRRLSRSGLRAVSVCSASFTTPTTRTSGRAVVGRAGRRCSPRRLKATTTFASARRHGRSSSS